MLERNIVDLIEGNALRLSREIEQRILTHPSTPSYRKIEQRVLHDWVYDVCSRFSFWLSEDSEKGEVQQHYRNLGKERFRQNFALSEVISALYLTKRRLWEFIAAGRQVDSTLNLNQIVEASLLLVRFFDHAVLHTTEGYEDILQNTCDYLAPLSDPEQLAAAIAAKQERVREIHEGPKLPNLCFSKGMIRLG